LTWINPQRQKAAAVFIYRHRVINMVTSLCGCAAGSTKESTDGNDVETLDSGPTRHAADRLQQPGGRNSRRRQRLG
jgi:hypothetical protein